MACGTGKTFTALRVVEGLAPQGHVLFLVPSLSLLSQTLREWTAESTRPIHSLAVCSETPIGKRTARTDDHKADITTYDLAFPATTSARQIVRQYEALQRMATSRRTPAQMTVVFSMDDPALFGEEFHRLGFGEAVGKSLLSDYKVLVLAVDEKDVDIVLKCGDRRYWESWAKDVALIAERHSARIRALLKNGEPRHRQALEKEIAALDKFYASVRQRASGIDNAEGRQRVVNELYDRFFRTAFPKMAERLGIVYTPIELVDFIIRSVEEILQHEFRSTLGAPDVHVIDPFTGTGTFIVRLLQSGLVRSPDLLRKYQHELHANEIVLLAYYIAAMNIEETFHRLEECRSVAADAPAPGGRTTIAQGNAPGQPPHRASSPVGATYIPFEGIVPTDTFQLSETKGAMEEKMFPENNRRVKRQRQSPIRVVMGNPPYSAGQDSENDSNQAIKYPVLDDRIRSTYAARSSATLVRNLYDSYVRALRWASDRINDKGIVGVVTNGSFIDSNNMDGLRACLAEEFTSVYVFNPLLPQKENGREALERGPIRTPSGS